MAYECIPPRPYEGECEEHGKFTDHISVMLGREFKRSCPECQAIRKAKEAESEARQEAMKKSMALSGKLRRAAIPARFTDKTFDAYVATTDRQIKALNACKEYAEGFDAHLKDGRCLMLMGKPGCGKTHMGAAIALHLCRETRHEAVYRTLPGLITDIRSTYGARNDDFSEADIMRTITRCSLLVLDEIGATKTSEFEMALLFNIINTRYEDKLPTVIISNLKPTELKDAIGERCVDRLREGGGIVVGFDWESKRGVL